MNLKTGFEEMGLSIHYVEYQPQPTLEELKLKHDSIKQNIINIDHMNLSDKTKGLVIIELTQELFEIKCKMHKLIDEM